MAATAKRIYVVTGKGMDPRLVEASHPSIAMRHVAKGKFAVEVASQDDLVFLIGKGTKVEQLTAKQEQESTL